MFRFRLFATDGQSASLSQIFTTVGQLRSSCWAPSLTRGQVCNLLVQFAVTLRSKSRRPRDQILLSHSTLRKLRPPSFTSGGDSNSTLRRTSEAGGNAPPCWRVTTVTSEWRLFWDLAFARDNAKHWPPRSSNGHGECLCTAPRETALFFEPKCCASEHSYCRTRYCRTNIVTVEYLKYTAVSPIENQPTFRSTTTASRDSMFTTTGILGFLLRPEF
jgi:hypothetical protein